MGFGLVLAVSMTGLGGLYWVPQPEHEQAVMLAQGGECSHGGHGWDGETCSEIPAPDAHAECCAPCEHCLPGYPCALCTGMDASQVTLPEWHERDWRPPRRR